MSTSCAVVVSGKTGHWTYEVHCGRKIVARGHRSTRALAETAGAREMAVYASVSGGKRKSGGGGASLGDWARRLAGGVKKAAPKPHGALALGEKVGAFPFVAGLGGVMVEC